jgi:hypothetical protein
VGFALPVLALLIGPMHLEPSAATFSPT